MTDDNFSFERKRNSEISLTGCYIWESYLEKILHWKNNCSRKGGNVRNINKEK